MKLRSFALVPLLVACGRGSPTPQDAAPPSASLPTSVASVPSAASAASTPPSSTPAAALPEPPDGGSDAPYLRGATWVSCKDGFRAESTPERDLVRLGMLCGPNHGLRREGEMARGTLKQGATHRASFAAKRDQCYRVMATWEASLQRMSLRVLDPGGAEVAQTESDARWLLVEPQGAFCAERTGDYQVELRAVQGEGRFAAQVWMLK